MIRVVLRDLLAPRRKGWSDDPLDQGYTKTNAEGTTMLSEPVVKWIEERDAARTEVLRLRNGIEELLASHRDFPLVAIQWPYELRALLDRVATNQERRG